MSGKFKLSMAGISRGKGTACASELATDSGAGEERRKCAAERVCVARDLPEDTLASPRPRKTNVHSNATHLMPLLFNCHNFDRVYSKRMEFGSSRWH